MAEQRQPSRKRRASEEVAEESCILSGCCLLDGCMSVVAFAGAAVWLRRRR